MATITSFEELDIWKNAQQLGAMIYALCEENPRSLKTFHSKTR